MGEGMKRTVEIDSGHIELSNKDIVMALEAMFGTCLSVFKVTDGPTLDIQHLDINKLNVIKFHVPENYRDFGYIKNCVDALQDGIEHTDLNLKGIIVPDIKGQIEVEIEQ